MSHDPKARLRRQREPRPRKKEAPSVCTACKGLGAVRSVWPSSKDRACYWFAQGARTCSKCDGTGENDATAARDGLAGITEALGAGDPQDWPQEDGEE